MGSWAEFSLPPQLETRLDSTRPFVTRYDALFERPFLRVGTLIICPVIAIYIISIVLPFFPFTFPFVSSTRMFYTYFVICHWVARCLVWRVKSLIWSASHCSLSGSASIISYSLSINITLINHNHISVLYKSVICLYDLPFIFPSQNLSFISLLL